MDLIFLFIVIGFGVVALPWPSEYRVESDDEHLAFHRPLKVRAPAIVLSAVFGTFLYPPIVTYFANPARPDVSQDYSSLFMVLIWGPLFWLGLTLASPYRLTFDLRDRTYTLITGFFPLKLTERGTFEDIECLTLASGYARSQRSEMYRISLRWKRVGIVRRWPSRLEWTPDRTAASDAIWDYSQKLGATRGEAKDFRE